MATVELRPGDNLSIIWKSTQETPLGVKEIESNFNFSYDELITRLNGKSKPKKSKKSGTEGAKFSRIVALSANALKKGKWSTGANIDREEVFQSLYDKFNSLAEDEYKNITDNARSALKEIYAGRFISIDQKNSLRPLLEAAKIET